MKVKFKEIKNYAKRIRQKFNPQKIILFGSYAYGHPSKDSDVDLLVIMETQLKSAEQMFLIRKKIPSQFPLDLIVKTSKEIKERIKEGDFFYKTLLKKGKEL